MPNIETEFDIADQPTSARERGLFLIRVALGVVFIAHGWLKFTHLAATIDFFATINLSIPFVYGVTALEFFGGLSLLLGILTRWSGWLLALDMLFAIYLVQLDKGFVGGFEFELVLLLALIGITMTGPGAYSLARKQTPPIN